MASRPDASKTISKSNGKAALSPNWTPSGDQAQSNALRPLSDIREITEPSVIDSVMKRSAGQSKLPAVLGRQSSLKRVDSVKRHNTVKIVEPRPRVTARKDKEEEVRDSSNASSENHDCSSIYSIPPSSVPVRRSSQIKDSTNSDDFRLGSPHHEEPGSTVPDRGQSHSPVKQSQARLDPVTSDSSRHVPSKTFTRSPCSVDILENPTHRHSRVRLDLQIIAPLFVGGGSVEGYVRVYVDDADRGRQRRNLEISRVAVDLLGTEELLAANRKNVFLSLATELLDNEHPPPRKMVESLTPQSSVDPSWILVPSISMLPFRVSLPLDTGPPPFQAKNAKIKYLLCATLIVVDTGRSYSVRCSQEIAVLPTYDPEKALRSLPSPLTAHDELVYAKSGELESIKITAGLHRQVWVSGTSIFVDVHIANSSHKRLKKLELSIERDVLCYRHAPAATLEQSAGQARMFQDKDQTILCKSQLKQSTSGWNGVEPWSTMVRTCDVELPRGHATVRCGKYFEVRFFLNITLGTTHTKMVMVQLPLILIHMNSLDVVPNAVNQVAAAIEEKRSRRRHRSRSRKHSPSEIQEHRQHPERNRSATSQRRLREPRRQPSQLQGRAFAAPRQQSLDRQRSDEAHVKQISQALERSPRKHRRSRSSNNNISPRQHGQERHRDRSRALGIHKTPSSLSLGGASVGSYTIFNGNHLDMYTPPKSKRPQHLPESSSASHEIEGVRDRIRNIRSLESLRTVTGRSRSKSAVREDRIATKKERERLQRERAASPPSSNFERNQTLLQGRNADKINHHVPELGPMSLGPHSLGLHGASGPVPTLGLGLGSHVHGHRVNDDDSSDTTAERTGYGYSVKDPYGHILTSHSSPDEVGTSVGKGVVRRASLKLREQIDKSRFEFKAVGARQKSSNTATGGGGGGVGALKGWLEQKTGRAKSRERQRDRAGWI